MAHYKQSRTSSRTSYTEAKWLKACSQLGILVNNWSGRSDLIVYGGDDTANGEAIAAFYHDTAEIEINLPKAFEGVAPESIGNLTSRAVQFEFPYITGAAIHEAMHAKFTKWDREYLATFGATFYNAFMTLEEPRIEAQAVIQMPHNKSFLRESALKFALEGINEAELHNVTGKWQAATLGALALGRAEVGILKPEDVGEIRMSVIDTLGEELYNELRAIWIAFIQTKTSQVEEAVALVEKWVELLREADPEGEGNQEELMEQTNSGEAAPESELGELVEEAARRVVLVNSMDMADEAKQEKWAEAAESRAEESKERGNKREVARKVYDKSMDLAGRGTRSTLSSTRVPTQEERVSAVKISQMLEKAKYRERSVTKVRSSIPQGKLKTRAAIQNAANKARGSNEVMPAWERKVRKHNDDPTLKLGVLVDISGSMGMVMEAMATTAWILAEAGRRIQAETSMLYFGSGVFPTLRRGQRLDQVNVYTAPDGTEEFGEAYSAIDVELGLTFGDGVRVLVIVSDGQFRADQREATIKALKECKQAGVAVVWITPERCYGEVATEMITEAAWGTHIDNLSVEQIALRVGQAAAESMGKVSAYA